MNRVYRQEEIGKSIVHSCYKVHKTLGPGLLEKVYEACVAYELNKLGLSVQRQVAIPIVYDSLQFDEGLRLDLLVEGMIVCELKAQEHIHSVWEAQIISHLKLTGLSLGFLINFNVPLIKNGICRFIN